jgi:hypothetical protein
MEVDMLGAQIDSWNALAPTVQAIVALASTVVAGLGFWAVRDQLEANRIAMQADLDAKVYDRIDNINQVLTSNPQLVSPLNLPTSSTQSPQPAHRRTWQTCFFGHRRKVQTTPRLQREKF